jgi:hypothetical protein
VESERVSAHRTITLLGGSHGDASNRGSEPHSVPVIRRFRPPQARLSREHQVVEYDQKCGWRQKLRAGETLWRAFFLLSARLTWSRWQLLGVEEAPICDKVRFIVVEWGNPLYQPILDRYIKGEDIPLPKLQQVWRNQTQVAS